MDKSYRTYIINMNILNMIGMMIMASVNRRELMRLDAPVINRRKFTTPDEKIILPECLRKPHQTYEVDGIEVPGVTRVLHILGNDKLIQWANNIGKAGKDSGNESTKAAVIGSAVHLYIESKFCNDKKLLSELNRDYISIVDSCDFDMIKKIENSVKSFESWYVDNPSFDIEFSEMRVICKKYRYGGTIDALADWKSQRYLFDFKTSGDFYSNHFSQLSAYERALREMNYPVNAVAIMKLDKNNGRKAKVMVMQLDELKIHFKFFKSLLKTYRYMVELDNQWELTKESCIIQNKRTVKK